MTFSNRWNRILYACWSPVYDLLVRFPPIARARVAALERLEVFQSESVLLVGVGTGEDIRLLPACQQLVGIDISFRMLQRSAGKAAEAGRAAVLVQSDGQQLPFADCSFDAAVLTLILSVVPDPALCLAEAVRVLKPGGRAVVMDKFLPVGERPSLLRRSLNWVTRPFGTDINRRFEEIVGSASVEKLADEAVAFAGAYRVILVRKSNG